MSRDFRRGLLWTALPVGLLSLLSTGGALTNGNLWWAWFIAGTLWGVGLIAVVIVAISRRGNIASGMMAGLAIGFVLLFVTCFANIATSGVGGPSNPNAP